MKNAVPLWPQAPCLKARFPPHRFQRLRNSSETEDGDKYTSIFNHEGYFTVNINVGRKGIKLVVVKEQDVEAGGGWWRMIHWGKFKKKIAFLDNLSDS